VALVRDPEDVLVIGVGNPDRGDDGAGLAVTHAVRKARPRARVLDAGIDAAPLLDGFSGIEIVVLVDAAESSGHPGRIVRHDATKKELPAKALRSASTHALGVREAIEMARVLGRMPKRRLVVIAIEGTRFEHGDSLSPEVERAVPEAARLVLAEIEAEGSPRA
jgi:hydrogenase maturation protease